MPNEKVSQMTAIAALDLQPTDLWMIARPNQDNFKLTHQEFLSLIVPPPTEIYVSQTIFVDPNFGDDGTGLRERQDKPFQSIDAAIFAAQMGDTVQLLAGDHFVFNQVVKNGVAIYGQQGSNIYSFTTLINASPFEGGEALADNWYWTGYSKVVYCSGPFINIKNNPTAILNLEFDSLNVNNISNGILPQDGLINLLVRGNYTCAGRNFSCRLTGNINAQIGGIVKSTFVNAFNGNIWNSGTAWSGTAIIKAKTFELPVGTAGNDWRHIYQDNSQGHKMQIELDYLNDASSIGNHLIKIASAFGTLPSKTQIKIGRVQTSGRNLILVNDPNAQVYLEVGNATGTLAINIQGGNVTINNSAITATAISGLSVGVLRLINSYLTNISGETMQVVSGTLSLMASTLVAGAAAYNINNLGGSVLSEGSKGNTSTNGTITGNFYTNPLYIY